ncbi:hypothetical protein [uncultured Planococcus sp.]|uniref:hypothetical protein n=1 Tax=uncultured Planococcus sp. TaxID=337815 RepID=UPI002614EDC9|nr:hypothetical protein [uncultured Planococcus sp.]
MTTNKLGLPEVAGSMAADVPLVVNNLAQAIDARAGVAGGLALHDALTTAEDLALKADKTALSTKAEQADLDTTTQQLAETANGLSFTRAENLTLGTFVASDPRYLDNIGDGYLYGSNSRSLYRATSENGPWTLIKAFTAQDAITGIRQLGDGEVILARSTDGLWKSTGWATNPASATWRQVLVTNGKVTQFSFDADPVSGWVSVTTYINGDMTNSRYVWLSKDNGNTFTQIFDMLDYEPTINKVHSHFHIATLDPYWNSATPRIWISYHKTNDDPTEKADPKKRIKYSDNSGVTWVDFSNTNYQPVVAIATPEGMLFGSDEGLVGVYIVKRTPNPSDMKYELFYAFRENIDGIFGWAVKGIKGANGAYHMAFRSATAGYSARIVTSDGSKIEETLVIPPKTASDTVDISDMVEYKGRLIGVYYNTVTGAGVAHKFSADAPSRGVQQDYRTGALEGGVAEPLGTSAGFKSKADIRGTAVGSNSLSALRGVAVGEQSVAGSEGTAVGSVAKATGNGTAIGKSATTENGAAFGRNSVSAGDGVAVGPTAKVATDSVAIGAFSSAEKVQTTAVGKSALASADYGIAIGTLSQATAIGSLAIGRNAKSTHAFSVALGYGSTTTAPNQYQVGAAHMELKTVAAPPNPSDGTRLFSRLNGAGKTELCAIFPTGTVVVIAAEI